MDKEEIERLRQLYWNLQGFQDLLDALNLAQAKAERMEFIVSEINSVVQSDNVSHIKQQLINKFVDVNRQLAELHEENSSIKTRLDSVVVENTALKLQLEEKTKEANIHWEDSKRYLNSMCHWRRVALEQEGKL